MFVVGSCDYTLRIRDLNWIILCEAGREVSPPITALTWQLRVQNFRATGRSGTRRSIKQVYHGGGLQAREGEGGGGGGIKKGRGTREIKLEGREGEVLGESRQKMGMF